jgi:hypothetical protein
LLPRLRRRLNHFVHGLVGDTLEGIGDPRKLKGNLIGAAGAPQYHDVLAAEIKRAPKEKTNENRAAQQQKLMTCNGERATCEGNRLIREHGSPPGWVANLKLLHSAQFVQKRFISTTKFVSPLQLSGQFAAARGMP